MDLGQGIYDSGVRLRSFRGNINVTDVQFLGQRGDSGGQEPVPAPEEYQEADLPF